MIWKANLNAEDNLGQPTYFVRPVPRAYALHRTNSIQLDGPTFNPQTSNMFPATYEEEVSLNVNVQ